jgi:hypothetical protein
VPVENGTIGNWTVDVLIKVVRDILENQPTTSLQALKVEELEVVRHILLKDTMEVERDRLHQIGNSGEASFENSWVNYSDDTAPAAYWKDAFGVIHIQGLIKSGTVGQAAFTLPPGYRPDFQHPFGTVSNGAIGRVDVMADGTVVPASPSNNTWVALDGIAFRPIS